METSKWIEVDADEDLEEALRQARAKLTKSDIPKDPEIFFDEIAHVLDAATAEGKYQECVEIIGIIFSKFRDLFDREIIYYLNWITRSLLALNQKDRLGPFVEAAFQVPSKKLAQDFLFKIVPRMMRADCFKEVSAILSRHLREISKSGEFFPDAIEELEEILFLAVVYHEYNLATKGEKAANAFDLESSVRRRLSGHMDLGRVSYFSAVLRILCGELPEPVWKREDFFISLSDRKKKEAALRQKSRELGTYFLLWLVQSKGLSLGTADACRGAALSYLSHQEKKNSSCFFDIEISRMDESLMKLTREFFMINFEMLKVYLEALPPFFLFLTERNLVEARVNEKIAQEANRLKRMVKIA